MFKGYVANTLILLLSGMLAAFAFAPFKLSAAIILSILLLLWFLEKSANLLSKRQLILSLYFYAMAYFTAQTYWIFDSVYYVIHANLLISILAMLCFATALSIFIVLAGYIYYYLKTSSKLFNIVILFPSCWVLCEWLRGFCCTGFPWCEVGYTQVDNVFFKGIYPLFGNYGVSWLVISLTGVCYLLIDVFQHGLGRRVKICLISYIFLVVVLGLYSSQINYTTLYGQPLKVSLLQGNISPDIKWNSRKYLSIYKDMVNKSLGELILMPETAIPEFEEQLPDGYISSLLALVHNKGASLIIGMPKLIDNSGDYVNAAILMSDQQRPYYAKEHLVPYGEYIPFKGLLSRVYKTIRLPLVGFSPGSINQKPIIVNNQKLAINLCYENGFGSQLIKLAKNATLMINLSDMAWYGHTTASAEHLQISQARALENQRYFIQDTNNGETVIINPDGSIKSKLRAFKSGILTDYVYGRVGVTPFELYGNSLVIGFIFLVIILGLLFRFGAKIKNN